MSNSSDETLFKHYVVEPVTLMYIRDRLVEDALPMAEEALSMWDDEWNCGEPEDKEQQKEYEKKISNIKDCITLLNGLLKEGSF